MERTDEILSQNWHVLAGYWDDATALNFIQGQGVPLKSDELGALQNKIRAAREYVRALPSRRQDKLEIELVEPDVANKLLAELQAESTFREHMAGMAGVNLAWVELSKLVVFQPMLNTAYIKSITVPPVKETARVIEFCLPPTRKGAPKQVVQTFNPTTNTFSIITENLDFRILGSVQGEDPQSGRKFVGFGYGGGLPQVSVAEYKGSYFLKNGYHRAFSLLQAGHRHMPCLLLHANNYASIGAGPAGFFPVDVVLSDKPPLLSDFTSPAAVPIPRRLLRVMVTVHAEVHVFPV